MEQQQAINYISTLPGMSLVFGKRAVEYIGNFEHPEGFDKYITMEVISGFNRKLHLKPDFYDEFIKQGMRKFK